LEQLIEGVFESFDLFLNDEEIFIVDLLCVDLLAGLRVREAAPLKLCVALEATEEKKL